MVIKVPVVLTYSNKGTKQAQKDLNGLGKSLKKFGLTSKLTAAGITASVTLLAKQSIAAAISEEKQARSLALTLKNLGKSYAAVGVNKFVENLQMATGVSEDKLRPALQRLITITNDVSKSQDLLKLALDISAGSTNSLETVVKALGRAYNGNNASLGRLGINLTKAELKTATFEQITAKLADTYRGQATEAAKTFGGQLAILGVAADEAKEKIGVSLINAIETLAGNDGIKSLVEDMDSLATSTANVITGFSVLFQKVGAVVTLGGWLTKAAKAIGTVDLGSLFGANKSAANQPFLPFVESLGAQKNAMSFSGSAPKASALGEERKAIAAGKLQVQLNRKAADEKRKELMAQRALATSKKLAAKFDQENIAIEAALKGKLSDEDKARLLAMKALKSESTADDQKALQDLNDAQKKSAAEELARIKEAENARSASIAKQKSEFQALQEWLASNPLKVYTTTDINGTAITAPSDFGLGKTNATVSPPPTNASTAFNPGTVSTATVGAGGGSNIVVNVNAGTVADENKLTYIISNELTKFVRFGGITAPAGFI